MVERRVFVVGGHITNFVGRGSPNFNKEAPLGLKEYIAEAVQGALRASGCPGAAVDRSYVGNFAGELFNSQVGTALRPPLQKMSHVVRRAAASCRRVKLLKSARRSSPLTPPTHAQGHLGAAVAGADPALLNKPSLRLEAACASGGCPPRPGALKHP